MAHDSSDPGTPTPSPSERPTSSRVRKASVRAKLFQKPELLRIGRFILLDTLGAGAMGEVHAAYDEQLDRKVALKLVRSDLNASTRADARLLREAQTLAQVSHPNVVQVYDAGIHEGSVYLAMEFIRGQTLTDWLEDTHELPRRDRQRAILRRFIAAGNGLVAAHAAGLAHRDFKPDNVLVGEDGRVRVVDFGLARAVADAADDDDDLAIARSGNHPVLRASGAHGRSRANAGAEATPAAPMLEGRGVRSSTMPMGKPAPDSDPAALSPELLDVGETMDISEEVSLSSLADASESGSQDGDSPAAQRKAALRLTATGMVMGTPRYMAPEQMRGRPADHRSDQFSFCVALFHALFGSWPFAGKSFPELARAAMAGQVEQPKNLAEVPAPVRRALLRGLSSEPDERYPDMGALLRELEAYSQPRRGWLVVVAAAALVLIGVLLFALQPAAEEPCAGAGDAVEALWSPSRATGLAQIFANSELPYAETVGRNTAAMLDEFAASWHEEARNACEDTHLRQVQSAEQLDRRMLCLGRGERRLDALLETLQGGADDVIERAVELTAALPDPAACRSPEAVAGPLPPMRADTKQKVEASRKRLTEARTQELLGHFDQALGLADAEVENARALLYSPILAEALHQRGRAFTSRGQADDYERAERDFLEVAAYLREERDAAVAGELWHDMVRLAARAHSDMSVGFKWAGREEAEVERSGNRVMARAEALNGLGRLYGANSEPEQKAEMNRQAIELVESSGELHPLALAKYHHSLANALGSADEAGKHWESARELFSDQLGDTHPSLTRLLRDYGRYHLFRGEYERAHTMYADALKNYEASGLNKSVEFARLHFDLVDLDTYSGNFEAARKRAHEATAIHELTYPEYPNEHRYSADPYIYQGYIDLRERRFDAARAAFQHALEIRQRHLPAHDPRLLSTRRYLAEALLGMGRSDDAMAQIANIRLYLAGVSNAATADTLANAQYLEGRIQLEKGHVSKAVPLLEEAYALADEFHIMRLERGYIAWYLARARLASGAADSKRNRALAEEARDHFASYGEGAAFERDAVDDWLARLGR